MGIHKWLKSFISNMRNVDHTEILSHRNWMMKWHSVIEEFKLH